MHNRIAQMTMGSSAGAHATRAARGLKGVAFAASAALALAACDDGADLEAQMKGEAEHRVTVSPEEKKHRQEVIGSVAFFSMDVATQIRNDYNAIDAGDDSRAVAGLGGAQHVRQELRAAELYHYAHKLDGCIADKFGFRDKNSELQFLRRLAEGPAGASLIAEAKRIDPDGYAYDLSGYGKHPNSMQRAAAAYDTLSLQWSTSLNKGSFEPAFQLFARTMRSLAQASNGQCVPDPKLLTLLDSSQP